MACWKWLVISLICLASSGVLALEAGERGLEYRWRLIKEKNGISVYVKHNENSRLKTFKGVKDYMLEDPYSLVALYNDYSAAGNWVYYVKAIEDLGRTSPTDRYVRVVTDLPWPVKDREAVAHVVVRQDADTKDVEMVFINDFTRIPLNHDYIRFPEYHAVMYAEWLGENKLRISFEAVGDLGGYLPAWLINIFASDIPYNSLLKLEEMLHLPQYQGHVFEYIDVPAGWDGEIAPVGER